jgi:hypothetical protein
LCNRSYLCVARPVRATAIGEKIVRSCARLFSG